jgi:glycosyltransferase involved in cell wall biosynthesis
LPMVVLDGSMEGLGVTSGVDHGAPASVGELADVLIDAVNDVESLERWAASALSAVSGRFSWSDRGESLVDRVICLRAER